jgi:TonB family protein
MNVIDELTKGKYGSMELKRYVGPNLIRGLIFSVLIHSAVIAAPWIVTFFKGEDAIPDKVYVLDENILRKLKQLKPGQAPPKIARPKLPEEQPEIMKQEDLAQQIVEEYAQYDTLAIDPNAQIVVSDEVIPDAGVFIPFEVPPQPLADFSPQPAYPDIAQKAGTSGKVVAQVYVDKEGNVKKWKIVQAKPEGLGFEQEVEKVITKWRFTPAIQQGNPVGVWIAIPFTFKVKQ